MLTNEPYCKVLPFLLIEGQAKIHVW